MNAFPILLLGGAALLILGGKNGGSAAKASAAASGEPQEAYVALKNLTAATGNKDFDPDLRAIFAILLEVQLNLGVEPSDGRWSVQTQRAIEDFIASHKGRT